MSFQDEFNEDAHVEQAVNAAAREVDSDASEFASFGTHKRLYKSESSPDLKVFATGDREQDLYGYTVVDTQSRLGHHACGRLLEADPDALSILAVTLALTSVTKQRAHEALCERYGFVNKRAAAQSLKKMIVHIFVTDPVVAELGQVISDAVSRDLVPFLRTASQPAYAELAEQLRRFDVTFHLVAETHPALDRLDNWIAATWPKVQHSGPVYSLTTRLGEQVA